VKRTLYMVTGWAVWQVVRGWFRDSFRRSQGAPRRTIAVVVALALLGAVGAALLFARRQSA
jgi:hypothetical protein